MPSLSVAQSVNCTFAPQYLPVAVFVGGTSGVGRGMAENFARYTKGNAHIILCGRNKQAAESIIASFPTPTVPSNSDGPIHEFVYCDATLMRNVHATTTDLLSRLPKVNFLVLSTRYLSTERRNDTDEGIDVRMALNYYSRWKFIHELMPLLRKAKDAGEDAKVLTVLSAGRGGPIDPNDFGLQKTFSFIRAARATSTYNDLMIEEFASQEPTLAFSHIYPGQLNSPILRVNTHWLMRLLNAFMLLMMYPWTVSREECGEYMWYAIFVGDKGSFRRGSKGDDLGKKNLCSSEELRKKLWDHTVEICV